MYTGVKIGGRVTDKSSRGRYILRYIDVDVCKRDTEIKTYDRPGWGASRKLTQKSNSLRWFHVNSYPSNNFIDNRNMRN